MIIVLLALVGPAGTAQAHGILQGSSPAANAVLPSSPPEVILAFNEPVDETFSRVAVLDASGQPVGGPSEVVAGGTRIRAVLPARLPAGSYVVRWRVLSRVDGHVSAGAFVFAVGAQPAPRAPADTGGGLVPALALTRWLSLLAALVLAGGTLFAAVVLRPALAHLDPETAVGLRAAALPALDRLRVWAALLLLGAAALEFGAQGAAVLGGAPAGGAVLLALLTDTRAGWSLLVRVFMTGLLLVPSRGPWRILRPAALVWFVVLTAVIAVLGGPGALRSSHVTLIVLVGTVYGLASVIAAIILPQIPDLRIPQWGLTRPIAAALLLSGFTLTSHAVAGGAVAVAFDWLHLLAAAVWLGALPALLVTFRAMAARDRAAIARVLVPRVSRLALGALIVMAATGLAAARRTVPALEALATSLYGRALLVKLALVLLVVALGAINRFILRPRIAAGRAGALEAFRRSVAAEVALGTLVLLAVGVLTTVPPAAVSRQAPAPPLVLAGIAGPWHVRLELAPARPGWSEVRAEITGLEDARPVGGAAVQVVLTALDHAEDRAFDLQPRAAGYAASGDLLTAGWWEVTVVVRAGVRAARTSFPLIVGADRAPAPSGEARAVFAAVRSRMRAVRTWRETEQITDGAGGVALTRFEAQAPDRLAFRTSGGMEAVIVGAVRYSRERGGPWTKDTLPQPIALAGPLRDFFEGAEGIRLGREAACPDEPCRVLLWDLPRAQAHLAALVGGRSRTVRMLWMVAPGHHMTSRPHDLGAPVRIVPPVR